MERGNPQGPALVIFPHATVLPDVRLGIDTTQVDHNFLFRFPDMGVHRLVVVVVNPKLEAVRLRTVGTCMMITQRLGSVQAAQSVPVDSTPSGSGVMYPIVPWGSTAHPLFSATASGSAFGTLSRGSVGTGQRLHGESWSKMDAGSLTYRESQNIVTFLGIFDILLAWEIQPE